MNSKELTTRYLKETMEDIKYCVYLHINPIKQEVFYVGIGDIERPYNTDRNKWWKRIVKKYGYDIIIIHENLSWKDVCALEIKYIAQIGRKDKGLGSLINLTDGGEGFKNKHSAATKLKISLKQKGRVVSEETKQKLRGRKLSVAQKKKHRESLLGNTNGKGSIRSEEQKNKLRQPKSEEFKEKMKGKKNSLGHTHSHETKLKMSLLKKGKPWPKARRDAYNKIKHDKL